MKTVGAIDDAGISASLKWEHVAFINNLTGLFPQGPSPRKFMLIVGKLKKHTKVFEYRSLLALSSADFLQNARPRMSLPSTQTPQHNFKKCTPLHVIHVRHAAFFPRIYLRDIATVGHTIYHPFRTQAKHQIATIISVSNVLPTLPPISFLSIPPAMLNGSSIGLRGPLQRVVWIEFPGGRFGGWGLPM
jgi:hypothetical protein